MPQDKLSPPGRRVFLWKALSSCALCGLAGPNLLALAARNNSSSIMEDKSLNSAGMTCQDVFNFAYRDNYIPLMVKIGKIAGKENMLQMLMEASSMVDKNIVAYWEMTYPNRTINDWLADLEQFSSSELCKNALSCEILNKTASSFEMKITECLWAKTFRNADAAEIGYAGICFGDYATTRAFNPKLKFTRDKVLMKGDDCCHATYEMET